MKTVRLITCDATPLKTEHWEYTCKQCGKHFENPVA